MDRFDELTVFLRVVEAGSFSGAARALAMSPSAVSKLVGRLEARLGARLFDRIAGSIRLTQEGERFRIHGRRVVEAMTDAENAVAATDQEVSGVLHVHTPLTFAKYVLAPLLPRSWSATRSSGWSSSWARRAATSSVTASTSPSTAAIPRSCR